MMIPLLLLAMVAAAARATSLDDTINRIYEGIMARSDTGGAFLIRRPFSETPGDAVSEGVGYGLMLSLYCDDQEGFNRITEGAESIMWNGQYYNWRADKDNRVVGYGAAVDAEQDIAFSFIMAQRRVRDGEWEDYRDGFYEARALTILDNLWNQGVDNGIVRAGYGWGGSSFVNAGYFAPAWYRIFQDVDPSHDWISVVDKSYEVLQNSPGYDRGLIPDWMQPDGQYTNNLGYNAYGDGRYMYKDAIRALWRIGTDALWYGDERAKRYIRNAYAFLSDIEDANFFQMDGTLVPDGDVWVFDGGIKTRPRREHSPLTVGMWLIPIMIEGTDDQRQACLNKMMSFYEKGADYWGLSDDPVLHEDIRHNEMYFEQFLGEFGALVLAGRWIEYQ
jgi:hypothetical protein